MAINEHGQMLIHIKGKVDDFNKKYDQVISRGEQMKQKFAQVAKFIAGAYVAGRIINAFKKIIGETIEMGVELDKLRKQWGMNAVEIQRLQYATKMANVDFSNMKKIVPIIAYAMTEAYHGMGTYIDGFDRLGINVRDSEGKLKSAYDVILEMSDYMRTEGVDATTKLGNVKKLLGRSGAELIPLLMEERRQLELWGDEAERMTGTLSDDMVDALVIANRNLTELKETTAGLKTYMGVMAIPQINEYILSITNMFKVLNKAQRETISLKNAIVDFAFLLGNPIASLIKMKNTLKKVKGELGTFVYTVEEGPKKIKPFTDALDKKTKKLKDQIKEEKYFIEFIAPQMEGRYKKVAFILSDEMVPALKLTTTELAMIRSQARLTNQAFAQFGSTVMKIFREGKIEAMDFLRIIAQLGSRMLLMGAPGPFEYFLSGFFGSFEKGGAMFLKDFRPRLMQEGGATIIKEPTAATPMGNIAHKGEIVLTPEQTMDIINRPIYFNVFNADPDMRIERIMESSMGAQQKFGRFLEEKVLRERGRLKGNE